jgi:hypothetical protein
MEYELDIAKQTSAKSATADKVRGALPRTPEFNALVFLTEWQGSRKSKILGLQRKERSTHSVR